METWSAPDPADIDVGGGFKCFTTGGVLCGIRVWADDRIRAVAPLFSVLGRDSWTVGATAGVAVGEPQDLGTPGVPVAALSYRAGAAWITPDREGKPVWDYTAYGVRRYFVGRLSLESDRTHGPVLPDVEGAEERVVIPAGMVAVGLWGTASDDIKSLSLHFDQAQLRHGGSIAVHTTSAAGRWQRRNAWQKSALEAYERASGSVIWRVERDARERVNGSTSLFFRGAGTLHLHLCCPAGMDFVLDGVEVRPVRPVVQTWIHLELPVPEDGEHTLELRARTFFVHWAELRA